MYSGEAQGHITLTIASSTVSASSTHLPLHCECSSDRYRILNIREEEIPLHGWLYCYYISCADYSPEVITLTT